MEKAGYGLLRVLAVGVLVFGMGWASFGVLEAWEFFTTDVPRYSAKEEVMHGIMDVGAALICTALVLAVAAVLWHMKKILEAL